jgi:hypothetical protein
LNGLNIFGIQKPFNISSCRIRGIQLGKRRRNEK